MKVGVITFHSAFNYGASLQTWALQKTMKKIGHEPAVIHYHPDAIERLYRPIRSKNPVKATLQLARLLLTKVGHLRLQKNKKYRKFIQTEFSLLGDYKTYKDLQKNPPVADVYITGSDQVWNCDHTGGYDPAYFLGFVPENAKRISYAASVGAKAFKAEHEEMIKKELEKFDAISIREASFSPQLSTLVGRDVEVVADPTLLLMREEYEELKEPHKQKEPYLFVYMMEKNPEVIALANKLSKSLGLPIVQRMPRKQFQNETKNCYLAMPGEFLSLIEGAEYVITNSFHGTVFSLIYEKPFVSMLHSETGSRTIDLLKSVGEESHLLYSKEEFEDMGQFEIKDKEMLRKNISQKREESLAFLKKSIG